MTTQAERLVSAIRRRKSGMTWGDIEALRISTCPWARLSESAHKFLRPGEQLVSRPGRDGLVRVTILRSGACGQR